MERERQLITEKFFDKNSYITNPEFVFDMVGLSTHIVQNINYGMHNHLHYEFLIVLSGKINHAINTQDNIETLSVGDFRLIPPNTYHSLSCQKESVHRDILISPGLFNEIISSCNLEDKTEYFAGTLTIDDLDDLSKKLKKFKSTLDIPLKKLISIEIFSFLMSNIISQEQPPYAANYPEIVNKLLNYFDRPQYLQLSLNAIIKHENYSPIYVSALFKKYLNTTPTQYLKEKRLKYVCYYLKNTSYTLDKICSLVGLDNLSYLHKIFKNKFNMSPSEYRKKHQK